MANTTYNGSLVKLWLEIDGTYKEAVCSTELKLDQTASEIDSSSKCGTSVLSGKKEASFSTTLQMLRDAADTGTVGAREIRKFYESGDSIPWKISDAYTGGTIEDLSGDAIITAESFSWPNEDVATADFTFKINGEVVDAL